MSKYSSQIQKHVYNNLGEIETQLGEVEVDSVQDDIRRVLEENDFYAPDFVYNDELLEIITERDLEDPDEVCFDGIESAMEAVKREANAIVDATYYAYLRTALEEVEEALQDAVDYAEAMNLEIESIEGGLSGLGHLPHDSEFTVVEDGTAYWWREQNVIELTINGISFTLTIAEPESDDDDQEE